MRSEKDNLVSLRLVDIFGNCSDEIISSIKENYFEYYNDIAKFEGTEVETKVFNSIMEQMEQVKEDSHLCSPEEARKIFGEEEDNYIRPKRVTKRSWYLVIEVSRMYVVDCSMRSENQTCRECSFLEEKEIELRDDELLFPYLDDPSRYPKSTVGWFTDMESWEYIDYKQVPAHYLLEELEKFSKASRKKVEKYLKTLDEIENLYVVAYVNPKDPVYISSLAELDEVRDKIFNVLPRWTELSEKDRKKYVSVSLKDVTNTLRNFSDKRNDSTDQWYEGQIFLIKNELLMTESNLDWMSDWLDGVKGRVNNDKDYKRVEVLLNKIEKVRSSAISD